MPARRWPIVRESSPRDRAARRSESRKPKKTQVATRAPRWPGQDSEGIFPSILGHEGAGVVVEAGPGVKSVKKGDHVIPLYTPECRECEYCRSRKTNLCQAIRATQGRGVMPDGTSRFWRGGQTLYHYMGCSTFANYTVLPEIAVAKIRSDAPFDKVCYIGCGVTTGIGAGRHNTASGNRARTSSSRTRWHRAQRRPGRTARRRRRDRQVDINPARRVAERFGRDPLREPEGVGRPRPTSRQPDGGGADYSFECVGNVNLMRQALECCTQGWGRRSSSALRRPAPDRDPSFSAGDRTRLEGSRSAAPAGGRTCPGSSTGTWKERSESTSSSPTRCPTRASTTRSISCTRASRSAPC